jgi:acetate kinase
VVRARSVAALEFAGIEIDPAINQQKSTGPLLISSAASRIPVWVIPTNEELAIARETAAVLRGNINGEDR